MGIFDGQVNKDPLDTGSPKGVAPLERVRVASLEQSLMQRDASIFEGGPGWSGVLSSIDTGEVQGCVDTLHDAMAGRWCLAGAGNRAGGGCGAFGGASGGGHHEDEPVAVSGCRQSADGLGAAGHDQPGPQPSHREPTACTSLPIPPANRCALWAAMWAPTRAVPIAWPSE